MVTFSRRALLANTFGTLGYLSSLLLWIWIAVLYLPLIFSNEQVKELLLPTSEKATSMPAPIAPSPVMIIFALIVTIVIMAVTIFVLLRIPITIAKTGKTVTTKAAVSIEPLITHGKPLPPKEKRRLAASLIKLVKLFLVLIPVAAGFLGLFVPLALPFELVIFVSGILAAASVFWFSAQYISAAILGVKPEKLV